MKTCRHIALLVLLALLLTVLSSGCENTSQASLPPEAEGRTVITIGVLFVNHDEDRYIYANSYRVADAFNAAQDEIWVEVKPYMDITQTSDFDAGLQRMYSELAAGNHADIYEMLSLNAQALRDAGYLADWYPLMEADPTFRKEDYFTNIWELLETNGKLYQMALNFKLSGMYVPAPEYTGQDGWTLAEFADYMSEHQLTVGRERLLNLMLGYGFQFEYVDLEQDTCHFDDPAFLEVLAYLETLPPGDSYGGDITNGHIQGVDSHRFYYEMNGAYTRVVGYPTQRRSGPAISIASSYGLSSATEHPEACWAFIRWLLAEEQQDPDACLLYTGVPINRAVWESQLYRGSLAGDHEDSLFYGWMHTIVVGGKEVITHRPAMPQEELDYLREVVENASYVSYGMFDYEDITAIVEEEVLVFLAGDRTAEECARIIQSRVSTFLAERS